MSDYIKREDALRAFNGSYSTVDADDILRHLHKSIDVIKNIPAADVRENVRGEWIDKGKNWTVTNGAISMEIPVKECSVCGRPYLYIITDRFCPNCGADMRHQS